MESTRYLLVRVKIEHDDTADVEQLFNELNYNFEVSPTEGNALNYVSNTEILEASENFPG